MTSRTLGKPKIGGAALVIAICLWGIYQALCFGIADVIAYKAEYALKTWEKERRLPTLDEADYALGKASAAISWEPGNPEHRELKAHILTNKTLLLWGQDSTDSLSLEALELYQQSTQLRPKWPYSWARVALLKAYRNEFDDIFASAVAQAAQQGPWEPGVHKTLTEAGLRGWFQLDPDSRSVIISSLSRGLRLDSKGLAAIVNRHNRRDQVCAYLPYDRYTKALCRW